MEQRSLGPTRDLREGGAIGSKTGGSYAGDRTGDESSGKVADVENPPQVQDREGGKDQ